MPNNEEIFVYGLKSVNTQHGKKVVAEIQLRGEKLSTLLPKRYCDDFAKNPAALDTFDEAAKNKKLFIKLDGEGIYKNVQFIQKL